MVFCCLPACTWGVRVHSSNAAIAVFLTLFSNIISITDTDKINIIDNNNNDKNNSIMKGKH